MICTLSNAHWQQALKLSALWSFELIWKDWVKCAYQYNTIHNGNVTALQFSITSQWHHYNETWHTSTAWHHYNKKSIRVQQHCFNMPQPQRQHATITAALRQPDNWECEIVTRASVVTSAWQKLTTGTWTFHHHSSITSAWHRDNWERDIVATALLQRDNNLQREHYTTAALLQHDTIRWHHHNIISSVWHHNSGDMTSLQQHCVFSLTPQQPGHDTITAALRLQFDTTTARTWHHYSSIASSVWHHNSQDMTPLQQQYVFSLIIIIIMNIYAHTSP